MGVKYKGYGNHGKWQDYMPSGRNSNSYSEILKVGGKYGKRQVYILYKNGSYCRQMKKKGVYRNFASGSKIWQVGEKYIKWEKKVKSSANNGEVAVIYTQ